MVFQKTGHKKKVPRGTKSEQRGKKNNNKSLLISEKVKIKSD